MRATLTRLAVAGSVLVVAGCGGSAAPPDGAREFPPAGARPATDATFRLAISSDPGALDFAVNQQSTAQQVMAFAYDGLVASTGGNEIVAELASEWRLTDKELVFTIRDGVTCSDGTPVTPSVIAGNFAYYKSPEVQFPVFGDLADWDVKGNDEAGTVTFDFGRPPGFPLRSLADIPIVCGAGLEDRSLLKSGTSGSGPYVLVEALPNDKYVLERRDGYAWGPKGATTDEAGLPKKVELDVVQDQATAVNLLLSGDLDGARITGENVNRLPGETRTLQVKSAISQVIYNHADGHPTSDPDVRRALTMALDRKALAAVANGEVAGNLIPPFTNPCRDPGNGAAVPGYDLDKAGQLLDQAGWVKGADGVRTRNGRQLALSAPVSASAPPEWQAAAELAVQSWRQLGMTVDTRKLPDTALLEALSTGDWDVSPMFQVNVPDPAQLTGFLSGPVPPDGQNLLHIANTEYVKLTKEALTGGGTDACELWNSAERALYEQADIIPVTYGETTWGMGTHADYAVTTYGVVPTSIRIYEG